MNAADIETRPTVGNDREPRDHGREREHCGEQIWARVIDRNLCDRDRDARD